MAQETRGTLSQDSKDKQMGNVGTASASPAVGREQKDRQRPIETGRDAGDIGALQSTGRPMARTARSSGVTVGQLGTSVNRTPNFSPARSLINDPFVVMQRMAEDMDQLFANFGFPRLGLGTSPLLGLSRTPWRDTALEQQSGWTPQVEVFRRENNVVLRADLPGLKKEDINIEIDDGILTLSGEREDEHEENRDGYYRSERHYGQFLRTIQLPEGVQEEACEASFSNGVLEVTIPIPADKDKQARKVQIH